MGYATTISEATGVIRFGRASSDLAGERHTDSMRALNDHECIALAQRGDNNAFDELVRRHQHRVYRFVLRMSGCPDDALDLTQETFLKAYQAMATWRPDALFQTWLLRIARNAVVDHLRRKRFLRWVPIAEGMEFPDQSPNPEAQAFTDQTCKTLEHLLQKIPHLYREALVLREIEGMSYGEIAETLSISQGTVKSRIARARSLLVESMQRRGHLPFRK